jgi:hypothetical protein
MVINGLTAVKQPRCRFESILWTPFNGRHAEKLNLINVKSSLKN